MNFAVNKTLMMFRVHKIEWLSSHDGMKHVFNWL